MLHGISSRCDLIPMFSKWPPLGNTEAAAIVSFELLPAAFGLSLPMEPPSLCIPSHIIFLSVSDPAGDDGVIAAATVVTLAL